MPKKTDKSNSKHGKHGEHNKHEKEGKLTSYEELYGEPYCEPDGQNLEPESQQEELMQPGEGSGPGGAGGGEGNGPEGPENGEGEGEPKPNSSGEEELMNFALGKRVCDDSVITRGASLLALAILGTLLFVLLSWSSFDNWLAYYIPNSGYRLAFKAIIFFLILYLLELLLANYRDSAIICA